jgi:hypothetical protein
MATKKIKRFQEGGLSDEADKAAGLEASKDDKVGFLERLRMGNIDDPESEAYKRFGAGRGRAARVPVEDRVGTPVEEIRARDTSAPQTISDAMMERGRAEGMRTGSGDASVAEMYSGPRTKPIEASAPAAKSSAAVRSSSPASPTKSASPKMQEQSYRRTGGDSSGVNKTRATPTYRRTDGDTSGTNKVRSAPATSAPSAPAPRKSAMDMIPTGGNRTVEGGEKIDSSELGRNVANTLAAVGPRGLSRFSAIGRDVVGMKANRAKEAADRSAELANELRKGQAKTKFTSQSKSPSKRTKKFDDSETGVEFKRGGRAMKSGGAVNPASKRADGIATRGKTRCKIC